VGDKLESSSGREGALTIPSSFSVAGYVDTVPSCWSPVIDEPLEERRENINQVSAANKDDEIKNREVNITNATIRCEYINHLKKGKIVGRD
jgi:hypothetical protein